MRNLILAGWLFIAALAGAGLYNVAFEVDRMQADLDRLDEEIRKEREAIHVLNAEWSYLARPSRIVELSEKYLPDMKLLTAEQIGRMGDLPVEHSSGLLRELPPEKPALPASLNVKQ